MQGRADFSHSRFTPAIARGTAVRAGTNPAQPAAGAKQWRRRGGGGSGGLMRAAAFVIGAMHAAAAMVVPAARVARPAHKLGGEWAGNLVSVSESGAVLGQRESLVTEEWRGEAGAEWVMHRREHRLQHGDSAAAVANAVLPTACSGSTTLRRGASMMEPEVLNARAWALDAVESSTGLWRCETIFDGVGGDRPPTRDGALECPKERTRVQCVLDATTGDLAPSEPVLIWQERCWSAAPADDYDELARDAVWVSSAVGLESFGDQIAGRTDEPSPWWMAGLKRLGGGVEMSCQPGVLEITLRAGA